MTCPSPWKFLSCTAYSRQISQPLPVIWEALRLGPAVPSICFPQGLPFRAYSGCGRQKRNRSSSSCACCLLRKISRSGSHEEPETHSVVSLHSMVEGICATFSIHLLILLEIQVGDQPCSRYTSLNFAGKSKSHFGWG